MALDQMRDPLARARAAQDILRLNSRFRDAVREERDEGLCGAYLQRLATLRQIAVMLGIAESSAAKIVHKMRLAART